MSGMAEIYLSGFRDLQKPIQRDVIKQLLKEPGIAGAVDTSTLLDILKVKLEDSTPRRDAETSVEQNRRPRPIRYDQPGTAAGPIRNYQASVTQLSDRIFPNGTVIDGVEHPRLSRDVVENVLGLTVNKKSDGGNSETHSRAVYRHLVDRYNEGDLTVTWEPRDR